MLIVALAITTVATLLGRRTNTIHKPSIYDPTKLVEQRESEYNNIYVYRDGAKVSMTFGVNQDIYTESEYNSADEYDLPVPYTRYMTATLIYPTQIRSILEIGSGGGRMAWYLHKYLPDAQITTVEIDPVVSELSKKYFGLKDEKNFRMVTADGRLFLTNSKEKYDIILVDAYRGPFVPFHLLTREFYTLVRDHLEYGGVAAQNIEPTTMLFDAAVVTAHSVFPQVEFYEGSGFSQSALTGQDVGGNVVMVIYDGEKRLGDELTKAASRLQVQNRFRYDLNSMLSNRYELRPVYVNGKTYFDIFDRSGVATGGIDDAVAKVMTDDFAPVDAMKAIENHNRKNSQ